MTYSAAHVSTYTEANGWFGKSELWRHQPANTRSSFVPISITSFLEIITTKTHVHPSGQLAICLSILPATLTSNNMSKSKFGHLPLSTAGAQDCALKGSDLLRNAHLNKGSGFSNEERDVFELHGLLPSRVNTLEEQVSKSKGITLIHTSDILLRHHVDATSTLCETAAKPYTL